MPFWASANQPELKLFIEFNSVLEKHLHVNLEPSLHW